MGPFLSPIQCLQQKPDPCPVPECRYECPLRSPLHSSLETDLEPDGVKGGGGVRHTAELL